MISPAFHHMALRGCATSSHLANSTPVGAQDIRRVIPDAWGGYFNKVIFLRKYMKQIQLDFTSFMRRIRDECVCRPWPMGAPSQKNNVASLFAIKQNSKLFTAGH